MFHAIKKSSLMKTHDRPVNSNGELMPDEVIIEDLFFHETDDFSAEKVEQMRNHLADLGYQIIDGAKDDKKVMKMKDASRELKRKWARGEK